MPGRRLTSLVIVIALLLGALASCGGGPSCVSVSNETTSVARLWNEATLDAIRRDFPAPTVHSRNLWHLSAVMWDAWTAYTPDAEPYFTAVEGVVIDDAEERTAAIEEAVSFAAHRLLTDRYQFAIGGNESLEQFDQVLTDLCLDSSDADSPGSPAAVGLAIADRAIEFGSDDGSSEITRYIDITYQPVNDPLIVATGEIEMVEPSRWQPLQLSEQITQNGQALGPGVQVFIGAQWGSVTSFALPDPDDRGITIDPGEPPLLESDPKAFVDAAIAIVGYADTLGGASGTKTIDISPGARGNNSVGANDGEGHAVNPATDEPYAPNVVPHSDYGRSIAEFWADGPDSETPPGHWNTLANETSDLLDQADLRWAGQGEPLSRLEWDLRLLFTLNASLHDAAIATWGSKRAYDYARPISMIRYLGVNGLLAEEPGLVEVVTEASAGQGGRHDGLEVGATAVRSWLGPPADETTDVAGVGWLDARQWLPYQRPTFVSPAFASYVSGHSAFSRAAADVLTAATGSPFFPGGMFTHAVEAGSLRHEEGPSISVELQWATFGDAADEAGESRRYGGIHVEIDDLAGRVLGAQVAVLAWDQAQAHFGP